MLGAGLVLAYAAFENGGVAPADWNTCVMALGVVMLAGYLPFGTGGVSAPPDRLLYFAVLGIPLWALLQATPLPPGILALASPQHARLAELLRRFEPQSSWTPLSIRPEVTLQYALRYLGLSAVFLTTRDLMWRLPDRPWLIAMPTLVVALGEAVIGILQSSSGVPDLPITGTFVSRNHFSAMLEMALPFAAGAVLGFAPRALRAIGACAGAALSALFLGAISISLSRAGFALAVGSLLTLAIFHISFRMRGRARAWGLAGSVAAGMAGAVLLVSGRLLDRMEPTGMSLAGEPAWNNRLLFARETLKVIGAYPLFGCGFGGFVSAVAPYRSSALTRTLDYAHNDYLQFLAEGGLVSFALALVVGVLVARALFRGLVRPPARHRRLALCCAVALGAGMLHSAVDLTTYVPATAMMLCWIAGMAAGLDFDRGPVRHPRPGEFGKADPQAANGGDSRFLRPS